MTLPPEIWVNNIYQYIHPTDRLGFSRVCRLFDAIVRENTPEIRSNQDFEQICREGDEFAFQRNRLGLNPRIGFRAAGSEGHIEICRQILPTLSIVSKSDISYLIESGHADIINELKLANLSNFLFAVLQHPKSYLYCFEIVKSFIEEVYDAKHIIYTAIYYADSKTLKQIFAVFLSLVREEKLKIDVLYLFYQRFDLDLSQVERFDSFDINSANCYRLMGYAEKSDYSRMIQMYEKLKNQNRISNLTLDFIVRHMSKYAVFDLWEYFSDKLEMRHIDQCVRFTMKNFQYDFAQRICEDFDFSFREKLRKAKIFLHQAIDHDRQIDFLTRVSKYQLEEDEDVISFLRSSKLEDIFDKKPSILGDYCLENFDFHPNELLRFAARIEAFWLISRIENTIDTQEAMIIIENAFMNKNFWFAVKFALRFNQKQALKDYYYCYYSKKLLSERDFFRMISKQEE